MGAFHQLIAKSEAVWTVLKLYQTLVDFCQIMIATWIVAVEFEDELTDNLASKERKILGGDIPLQHPLFLPSRVSPLCLYFREQRFERL